MASPETKRRVFAHKSRYVVMPVALLAGLTAACSPEAATAENTATTQASPSPASAPVAIAETKTPGTKTAQATATVKTLPLRLGHYVTADVPCNRASRADMVALLTKTGINLSCTFKKIEKTGATTYRVTSECSDGGAAWGRADSMEHRQSSMKFRTIRASR